MILVSREDMTYNAEDDYYICAYGILLFTYSFSSVLL